MTRKTIISLSLAVVLAVGSFTGGGQLFAAQNYTAATVPNVQLTDARRFVSNPDAILSPQTTAEIDRMCLDLRTKGLAEVAVVVVESVDNASLDNFAFDILNRWGVGRKGENNGLVISVVRHQRDIQFQTGYGLEGVLPDALCKRIQTVYMIPLLRDGDWDGGVLAGVRAVYNVLTDNTEELSALRADEASEVGRARSAFIAMLIFFGVFILLIVLSVIGGKRGGRGGGNNGGSGDGGALTGMLLGMLLGGMGRGGGGFGGGYGGGGFGGGSSGGGGARSRF